MATCEIWLARWLRRRGWVVFWLDKPARFCRLVEGGTGASTFVPEAHEGCWLALYEQDKNP